jgi:hypothetical protein
MNDEPRDHQASTADERFETLWTDYLEGLLDASGMTELDALLAADANLVIRAADLYQTHRRLGLLATIRGATEPTDAFVADVMHRLPADGETLTRRVMDRLASVSRPAVAAKQVRPAWPSSWNWPAAVVAGGGLLAALAIALFTPPPRPQPTAEPVRFASLARARFLDRETPARQAEVVQNDTYVLSSGIVELAFPRGATAIIEAPAAFRVCASDCLAVDAGRCSIHAPEAAEGFRVETPTTQVVDRGTRFVVSVDETADTEVQVIEGAADLFARRSESRPTMPVRLSAGEAARIDQAQAGRITRAPAVASGGYQRRLPDRIVSYSASLANRAAPPDPSVVDADPGVDTLESLLVQRNGRLISYTADQLIGVEVVHFRAGKNQNNLVAPGTPEWTAGHLADSGRRRAFLETDRLLTTGFINPGGSRSPPSSAASPAATADDETTPGIAFRFVRPVVNGPGPDVVVFDLQMLTDPPQGDAFHVGPLESAAGLGWHTVVSYDIDSTSPESRLLARFRLFKFASLPLSLTDLLTAPTNGGQVLPVRARCNAVGVDLADLGYADGAACSGIFLQDAADDGQSFDPTFIAGLPPLEDEPTATVEAAR